MIAADNGYLRAFDNLSGFRLLRQTTRFSAPRPLTSNGNAAAGGVLGISKLNPSIPRASEPGFRCSRNHLCL